MKHTSIQLRNFRYTAPALLLALPTLIALAIFSYAPAIEAIRHSLYAWDGDFVEEFVRLDNFRQLMGDLSLWTPLLAGGLAAFLAALADRPGVKRALRIASALAYVWFLVMGWLDYRPQAATLGHSAWVAGGWVAGAALLCGGLSLLERVRGRSLWRFGAFTLPFVFGVWYLVAFRRMGDWLFWMSFRLIFILIVANLFKMLPSIFTAVVIHRLKSEKSQYLYRVLFVIPMIVPAMVWLLVWKFFYDPNIGLLNRALVALRLDHVLAWLDFRVLHWGVFTQPFHPAWLGQSELIIPALIFWGFPWVGAVGVLIYLAGLQTIPDSVYEAAALDGIGWWGKFRHIELPLIMTQVRLNLILMIVGALQSYGFELILLGATGGPGNKGLTPGLYMFYQAFLNQRYGYACAIGLALFAIILVFTVVNQKFVRVEK